MSTYKNILFKSISFNNYKLIVIRDQDKYDIMNWRNQQIDVLRQSKPLTKENQQEYFRDVVAKLFTEDYPKQYLFSILYEDKLIGYGGLVHIDWELRTAEISFLTETARSKDSDLFINDWTSYLQLIKQFANVYLNLREIYTYAYDLRPKLYVALDRAGFVLKQRIPKSILINNIFVDVLIHNLSLPFLEFKRATEKEVDLYFNWANDTLVRENSFKKDLISYDEHVKWFNQVIRDDNSYLLMFLFNNSPCGQVRIQKREECVIGISIDQNYRGYGFATKMLVLATQEYFKLTHQKQIIAYIKETNKASLKSFQNAGFRILNSEMIHDSLAYKLILKHE